MKSVYWKKAMAELRMMQTERLEFMVHANEPHINSLNMKREIQAELKYRYGKGEAMRQKIPTWGGFS